MPVASHMVAGNLSLGHLEKGAFRLSCFAKAILLFKWVWKGFESSLCVCVCVQQGEVAAHFNSQFRLCVGVALITPKIKGDCVYNLLLACFLLMMVPGPAISSYGIWTVLCKRHKAGNTQELLFSPQTIWIAGELTEKGPHRWHGQELPASHTRCTHGFRHLWNL